MATQALKVKRILVTDVLARYTHEVQYGDGQQFVIIYGPNGVGKTKFLEVVDGLLNLSWRALREIPFGNATIAFEDGTHFEVNRIAIQNPELEIILQFQLSRPSNEETVWKVETREYMKFDAWLRKETPYLPFRGTIWHDPTDGEMVEYADLERRYGHRAGSPASQEIVSGPPDELVEFTTRIASHLIETQRLKIDANYNEFRNRHDSRQRVPTSTIIDYASGMKRLLADALAANSRITQQLDRTFPSRMLNQGSSIGTSEPDIRKKYEAQDKFRSRLAQIAHTKLDPELSLPERSLTASEISMLDLYLSDADNKLETFEELLGKITLLEEVVNARLLGKTLHIDALSGIEVLQNDSEVSLDLDSLSSGEQHEIILMYDLLFNVRRGSLVLIDEPEISLHVSWQIKFISDVERISRIAGFQFLVATHSPQIIDKWWGFAKQLGPEDAEF
ncbi:MAG: AAA family ATPase [Candidatus Nanopelagicaceae bacterium]